MTTATSCIIHSIVQLHRFIPVIFSRESPETIISGCLRRIFEIAILSFTYVKLRRKCLPRYVIKIIGRRKMHLLVVMSTQIIDTFWRSIRMILTSHMIRHEIKYYFQSDFMCTGYQRLEFLHTCRWIFGQIGIYIIIVFDSIRRPGFTLNHIFIILSNPIFRIVCLGSVFYNPRIPNIVRTQLFYLS